MARGMPTLWSIVLGMPFITGGSYGSLVTTTVPDTVGVPFIGFGVFTILIGLYTGLIAAPDQPTMKEGEEVIDTREPAQRAAIGQSIIGLITLTGAGYLLFFTLRPYVYPMVTLTAGLYLFSTGTYSYWVNSLTKYYLTTDRLIKEYRFLSLVRQGIPLDKIRGVEERNSLWETLVGLGSVRVASGGGAGLEIVVRNISTSTEFADKIRSLL